MIETNIPEGYKQTEVGVIPDDWEVKKLGEIAEVKGGKRLPKGKLLSKTQTPYPYIKVSDMFYGGVSLENIEYVPEEVFPSIKNYCIYKDDLFISVAGTLGIVGKITDSLDGANLTENADRLTGLKCDKKFLFYVLTSSRIQNNINIVKTTGAQPKLALVRIKNFQIFLPSFSEQKTIAQSLSDVDALITECDRLITKKRHIKQGTMQQLLTGKKRLPGFSGEWEMKKLGDLANIQRGASPRPIDSPIWYDNSSTVGWVRISDITASNGRILERTRDYLSDKGIAQSRFLPAGSLIMSICATVGVPVITSIDTCIHDGFVGFSKLNNIDQVFLYYKLKELEDGFKSMGQTGSQSNLNSDLVRDCIVLLPKVTEQKAIAQILSDMDTEIAALEQKRDKYKAIKQGMMQELLTGKTRIKYD